VWRASLPSADIGPAKRTLQPGREKKVSAQASVLSAAAVSSFDAQEFVMEEAAC
jgi:hypothetical protein